MTFEGQTLYLSEADAKHGITRSGVWLDVSEAIYATRDRFHQRYVRVEGTFNAEWRGYLRLFSGTIEHIVRIELLDSDQPTK